LTTLVALVPKSVSILMVTIPSDVSQLVVQRSITAVRHTGAPLLGLIENMADLFPGPDVQAMARAAEIPLLGRVPFDRALAASADQGRVFVTGSAEAPAARGLVEIAGTIRKNLESLPPDGVPPVRSSEPG
jgi:ATP-binding protein involved in chromosome partitioning